MGQNRENEVTFRASMKRPCEPSCAFSVELSAGRISLRFIKLNSSAVKVKHVATPRTASVPAIALALTESAGKLRECAHNPKEKPAIRPPKCAQLSVFGSERPTAAKA